MSTKKLECEVPCNSKISTNYIKLSKLNQPTSIPKTKPTFLFFDQTQSISSSIDQGHCGMPSNYEIVFLNSL